jgi:hypothetical protein
MHKLLILFLFIIASPYSHSADIYYTIDYTVKDGDTFATILRKYVKRNSIINSNTAMIHKTRSENPHIKEWGKLKADTLITLYITKEFIDISEIISRRKTYKILSSRPKGYHSSLFHMMSSGTFNQEDSAATVDINFSQHSFLSLGYTGQYYPEKKPYSFSGSIYIATLNTTESNLGQEISIAPELGINGYINYSFSKFSIFGGFDFERFSTFNTEAIIASSQLILVESRTFYLSGGFNKSFSLGKHKLFSRYSFSKSVATSTDFSSYSTEPASTYNGYKFLAYLSYKFNKNWFAHILFKYHVMSGPDNLSVFRTGIGLGYIIN